jgi:hypothetical protein
MPLIELHNGELVDPAVVTGVTIEEGEPLGKFFINTVVQVHTRVAGQTHRMLFVDVETGRMVLAETRRRLLAACAMEDKSARTTPDAPNPA